MQLSFKTSLSKRTRRIGIAALLLILAVGVFSSALYFLNKGQPAIKGVTLGSYKASEMERDEAQSLLNEKIEEYKQNKIAVRAENGETAELTPAQLGVKFHPEKAVDRAYTRGREGNIAKQLYIQARTLFLGEEIPVTATVDSIKVVKLLDTTLSKMHTPAESITLKYNKDKDEFQTVPAQNGLVIDEARFMDIIKNRAENISGKEIYLEQKVEQPKVRKKGIEEAREKALALLEKSPYQIEAKNDSWEVEKEDLISWLNFVPEKTQNGNYKLGVEISKKEVENYLTPFAPGLSKSPTNARFTMQGGEVKAFSLATEGYNVDIKKSAVKIKKSIENGSEKATLAYNTIEPDITNENVDSLGINSLIGRGETDFAGSPESRKHNIEVGADKYQGKLIAPGEEFSFNENLGPVTAAAGYKPELVIKDGKTIPEYGGGLCQVSTTMFRAAVRSGLEITDRYSHSYPVQYYGKPGFDATIYPPNPDLGFKNNTPGHILIQYRIVGTKLVFEIYGEDDGRNVALDGPHLYDKKPNGAVKAWMKQTVKDDDGNIIEEQTFYSNYKSPQNYPVEENPYL